MASGVSAVAPDCDRATGDAVTWKDWENYVPPTSSDNLLRVGPAKPKRSKYGAEPTVVDGIRFDSKKEADYYRELKRREQAGEIYDLRCQQRFELDVKGQFAGEPLTRIGAYVADFWYVERATDTVVVVDVKGVRTALYSWKKKHVEAQYGITVREV